jgi:hypothetical protein
MGWKWDAARKHDVEIQVTPLGLDKSAVTIVWGDQPSENKTLDTADAEKLLHSIAQQIQRLGYMM